jgi:myo-inositol 2-dehydrogenase/D-chiro-inositol 1-dehydrogenase
MKDAMTTPGPSRDSLRIGLIGHGRIGRVHAASIAAHPRADLAAVHDALPASAQEASDRYGARVHATATDLIADDDIDAVVIASPTPTHVDYLEATVLAGRATFCEKPIDLDITKVEACRTAIAGSDVPVMIGFHRRFDPSLREIHDAAIDGEIGRVESLRILARDPVLAPLEYIAVSGGQARDMAIHDLDLVRWLMPDEPATISAMGSVLIEPAFGELGDTDSLHVSIRTGEGRLAHIDNSRRTTYGYDQRLELFGSEGALEMTNQRPTSVEYWGAVGTQRRDVLIGGFIERYAQAYRDELDHFVMATLEDGPYEVGFEDGRRALIMADAVVESLERGRFVGLDFGA